MSALTLPVTFLNPQTAGSRFQFQFRSQTGTTNTVQARANLAVGGWSDRPNILGDGNTKTFVLPGCSAPTEFIRISTHYLNCVSSAIGAQIGGCTQWQRAFLFDNDRFVCLGDPRIVSSGDCPHVQMQPGVMDHPNSWKPLFGRKGSKTGFKRMGTHSVIRAIPLARPERFG